VDQRTLPGWITAAASAALRLAAEAATEADELLDEARLNRPSSARTASHVSQLEQSADLQEVATDLAGLLWAECEDVPRIATILEEPAVQGALEAVAAARRLAAQRLADFAASSARQLGAPAPRPLDAAGIRLIFDRANRPR